MYQNVNTGKIWKLNSVETIRTWKNEVKVYLKIYVFENGERWAEDLFIKHWRKVGEAQQSVHLTLGILLFLQAVYKPQHYLHLKQLPSPPSAGNADRWAG